MGRDLEGLMKLYRAVQELRGEESYLTAAQIEVFLFVARFGKPRISQIIESTGIQKATMSRILDLLCFEGRGKNTPERKWLTMDIDPEDRRHRIVGLTPKGQKVADKLCKIMKETT